MKRIRKGMPPDWQDIMMRRAVLEHGDKTVLSQRLDDKVLALYGSDLRIDGKMDSLIWSSNGGSPETCARWDMEMLMRHIRGFIENSMQHANWEQFVPPALTKQYPRFEWVVLKLGERSDESTLLSSANRVWTNGTYAVTANRPDVTERHECKW